MFETFIVKYLICNFTLVEIKHFMDVFLQKETFISSFYLKTHSENCVFSKMKL